LSPPSNRTTTEGERRDILRFPTARTWAALHTGTGPRYVVCNAAEGEPATFKDRLLVRRNPYRVIDGIQIAAHATGAGKAYLGLKEAFSEEFDRCPGP
jgi:NADH-quinone oxidoreductase subunit F